MIKPVADNRRLRFLPRYFGNSCVRFEQSVYRMADKMLENYKGGYWEYATTNNDAAFMYCEGHKKVIHLFSGESFEVDAVLAGIIVCIYAHNVLYEGGDRSDAVVENWQKLNDFAYEYAKQNKLGRQLFYMLD